MTCFLGWIGKGVLIGSPRGPFSALIPPVRHHLSPVPRTEWSQARRWQMRALMSEEKQAVACGRRGAPLIPRRAPLSLPGRWRDAVGALLPDNYQPSPQMEMSASLTGPSSCHRLRPRPPLT
ncbi:hypothetical protein AAFF_G00430480 [Aldrovandia affinis]|uniref:Uncharacterized protein n=1 Tax=Aldrovandia affinis TaxID=143900 RepID=A0AAD7WJD9_9TELE|nr:hypothetical protein AAFF_G00430480 [Aldrovandia affinis]